jgi:hypothetical protein
MKARLKAGSAGIVGTIAHSTWPRETRGRGRGRGPARARVGKFPLLFPFGTVDEVILILFVIRLSRL